MRTVTTILMAGFVAFVMSNIRTVVASVEVEPAPSFKPFTLFEPEPISAPQPVTTPLGITTRCSQPCGNVVWTGSNGTWQLTSASTTSTTSTTTWTTATCS